MKLLEINSVCGIRSTGRIATDIASEYEKNGWTCRIAYGRETVPEKNKDIAVRIGNETEAKINALKCRLLDNDGFAAKAQTKRFLEWASEYDPDVLWLHNLHGYYINIELLFAWIKTRPNMKVKWTLHDCWAFTGHCSNFELQGCEKWKHACGCCPLKKAYPSSLLFDRSGNNYEQKKASFLGVSDMEIITPSEWLAKLVRESFLSGYKTTVKHNTIDLSVFKPTPGDFRKRYGLEDKKIVLGVASAWGKTKGLEDFFAISKLLGEQYKVVLVGLKEKQKKRIPANILGITRTNSTRELAEIYTAADVFVNATYQDNYPTVNLEAQACGTPCITYRTGGSVESVSKENIVDQGDVEGLVKRIIEIVG